MNSLTGMLSKKPYILVDGLKPKPVNNTARGRIYGTTCWSTIRSSAIRESNFSMIVVLVPVIVLVNGTATTSYVTTRVPATLLACAL